MNPLRPRGTPSQVSSPAPPWRPFPNVPARKRFISLATFRRSGVAVPTPLWFARSDRGLYVVTHATAGKLKRIASNPSISVAPCRSQGKTTGPALVGTARVLEGTDRQQAARAISRRYCRLPRRVLEFEMRRRGGGAPAVFLELVDSDQHRDT